MCTKNFHSPSIRRTLWKYLGLAQISDKRLGNALLARIPLIYRPVHIRGNNSSVQQFVIHFDVCFLQLIWNRVLILTVSRVCVCVCSLGFSTYKIISSAKRCNFTPFFPVWMPFVSFSCLFYVARTPRTVLSRSEIETFSPLNVAEGKGRSRSETVLGNDTHTRVMALDPCVPAHTKINSKWICNSHPHARRLLPTKGISRHPHPPSVHRGCLLVFLLPFKGLISSLLIIFASQSECSLTCGNDVTQFRSFLTQRKSQILVAYSPLDAWLMISSCHLKFRPLAALSR